VKKIVRKYSLGSGRLQEVKMPEGSWVLSAQPHGREICLWVLVDPEAADQSYEVALVETGEPMGGDLEFFRYVATILLNHGVTVVHVFVGGGA
jgi:hypothetical protein